MRKRKVTTTVDLGRLALRSLEKGDLNAALRSLEEAERRGMRLEEVRQRLARAFSEQALSGDGADSAARIAAQREACALTPRNPIAWRDLGRLLHRLGDYAGALDAYDEAERSGDDRALLKRLAAVARWRMKGGPRSSDSIRSSTGSGSEPSGEAWERRVAAALLLLARGQRKKARTTLHQILQGDPQLASAVARNARHYLGRLLFLDGKPLEAIPHLRKASRIEEEAPELPNGSGLHLIRALLAAALESPGDKSAPGWIAEAEGLAGPEDATAASLGRRAVLRCLLQDGLLEDALPWLEEERKMDPTDPKREKDLALAYERLGAPEKAIRHWERAIRLGKKRLHGDRTDAFPQRFLVAVLRHSARLDRRMGRTAEASRKLSFSLQLDPDDLSVRKNLGEMLMGLGRYRDAYRCLSPIQDDPKAGTEVWTQMGIACDRMGRADDAISLWERASKRHPLAKRLLLTRLHERFLLRFRAGDLEGAKEEIERARGIDPGDRDIHLDTNCLALAGGADTIKDETRPGDGGGGRLRAAFSPRPEVALQDGPAVTRICCGDGTRCEAVRALILRLVEQDGGEGAAPVQKALLDEGCRMIRESLEAALDEAERAEDSIEEEP
ncbi:MAG: tetratricopeptide repeat protein [Planctomycetota bacterium]|nr:tetratricopeptide repeat protein [Planctomycetota bacterium]